MSAVARCIWFESQTCIQEVLAGVQIQCICNTLGATCFHRFSTVGPQYHPKIPYFLLWGQFNSPNTIFSTVGPQFDPKITYFLLWGHSFTLK